MALPEALRARGLALTMLGLFAAVAVAGVALRPLVPIDETRYVDVAWEMRLQESWFLPLKNHELYTDKPPMLFWLINLVWTLTGGVSEFAARLVGPAFALGTLAGTWALGRRLWGDGTGAVAAVVLSGLTLFGLYGGATMFDAMLACATLAGLWALLSALAQPGPNRAAWVGLGAALAFGVLVKGPVILFHLAPVMLSWLWWSDPAQRPALRDVARGMALALLVALGLVAIWVLPAAIAGGPEYRHMILWKQTAGRTVQSFAHARPVWWLAALLPLLLFPWVFSPSLWAGLAKLRLSDRGLRLMLVQAGAGLVLFSLISGKQVHYLVPELPAVALLFARALMASGKTSVPGRFAHLPLIGLLALIGLLPLLLSLGALGDARTQAMLHPLPATLGFALACAVLAGLLWVLPHLAGLALAGLGLVLACLGLVATTGLGPAFDSRPLAQLLKPHEAAGLAVLTPRYNAEFNFTGQITAKVDVPATVAEAEAWLAKHPGGALAAECGAAPLSRPADETILFNGTDWCLWRG